MTTTLAGIEQSIKELAAKLPNLADLVKKANAPPVVVVQETVFVFNGFDTITLKHLGLSYHFPFGEVTEVHAMPEYQEAEKGAARDESLTYKTIPLKGEFIAREMIDIRGFDKIGMKVFLKPPTKDEMEACFEAGKVEIFRQMEDFKLGRKERLAGRKGRKINADPRMYEWFKKYAPDDEMFAQDRKDFDSNTQIAAAIGKLTEMLEDRNQAKDPNALPPKKKNFEAPDLYAKRFKEWTDEQLKKLETAGA